MDLNKLFSINPVYNTNKSKHCKLCGVNPKYNPSKWEQNKYIKDSHNCYAYALNDIDKDRLNKCKQLLTTENKTTCLPLRPSPGRYSNYKMKGKMKGKKYTCKGLEKNIIADNKYIYRPKKNEDCKSCYYKIAYAVDPGKSFHFYRENHDKTWSHKEGGLHVKTKDASNKIITDPKTADRKYSYANFSQFCGYLCVPENNYKKTYSK